MKTKLLVLLFSVSCLQLMAQDQARTPKPRPEKKKKQVYEVVDNVMKVNVSSLLFRALAVQYERKLSRSKSFGMGIIYRPNFSTPILNVLMKDTGFTASAETLFMLKSSHYNALMLTPEFRFYFRKKAPRGLYLAPFLRYKRETFTSDYRYQETGAGSAVMKTGEYKNKINTMGAGILFGLQILTKKRMTIDFWFLGPWVGMEYITNSSKINTSGLNEYDRAYIESSTESYNNALGFSNQYSWSGSGFSNKANGFTFGARMIGINFGYSF
jgi:hypothetical protein